ncbi:hypothetical protein QR98_0022470 [Sarcoptes scabiei]|uniref:Uncharacterized protein n=1 Tax=Sarcoptes scabiei TaxID=52283 RepID=A0A131ZY79_SARSC|nr:hypothetical protein QR98_0022470 [Sarcoptes scabiei]
MSSSMADGDLSVISEGPTMRKYRHRTSYLLLTASYIGLLGLLTIIIAFSSPYWLSSHKYTYSSFVRLDIHLTNMMKRSRVVDGSMILNIIIYEIGYNQDGLFLSK